MRLGTQKWIDTILSGPDADSAWRHYHRICLELIQGGDHETANELMDARVDQQFRETLGELSPELKEEMGQVSDSPEQWLDDLIALRKEAAAAEQRDAVAEFDKILAKCEARGLLRSN